MKKAFIFVFLLFTTLFVAFYFLVYPKLSILTGYAAKDFCSCYYLAKRTPELIHKEDLYFSPVNLADCKIDKSANTVTATVFGLAARTAKYRDDFGCTILNKIQPISYKKPNLPKINYDTVNWPLGNRISDTLPKDYDKEKINQLVDAAFDTGDAFFKKTRAILILHNNQIIGEKYASGIDQNTPLIGWSMSKTVMAALIDRRMQTTALHLSSNNLFPAWNNDDRKTIALQHLLQMNSGLEWIEDYGSISHATTMLYLRDDMPKYATKSKLDTLPGKKWYYSSGTTNLLSGILRNTFENDKDYWDFPYDSLFYPLGMRSITFEPDASGNYVGSSYTYATARDWSRFGLLYLNNGKFNEQQLLSKEWVNFSTQPAVGSNGKYGAQLWLNHNRIALPDCPNDTYFMDGYNGQRIFIVPSKKLVVVRLGLSKSKEEFDFNQYLSEVIAAIN